ncbi:hypothetical protein BH10BAC1_BH10BAC1_06790 [soil metagenome]
MHEVLRYVEVINAQVLKVLRVNDDCLAFNEVILGH